MACVACVRCVALRAFAIAFASGASAFASAALRALRVFPLAFASGASAFASTALRSLRALTACVALRALALAFALNCVACVACVGCVIMETRLYNELQLHTSSVALSQGCGSRDLVLVSRPIKTTFFEVLVLVSEGGLEQDLRLCVC